LKQFTTTMIGLKSKIPIPKLQTISKFESPMTQTFWWLICWLMTVLHVLKWDGLITGWRHDLFGMSYLVFQPGTLNPACGVEARRA
jgi:hypothetical protein